MIICYKRILIVALLVAHFGFNPPAFAQNPPLKQINWGMTALSAAMWIPWIAKDARIYEKNGLDVDIVLLRGSGQSSQALLGGSLFAAPVALPQVMLADLNGADLVNVAHTIAMASSKLLVKPDIRRPEDLRGKKSCDLQHRLAGRFSIPLCAAQARHQPRSRNYLALHRHQRRTFAGAALGCYRRRRRDLSRRRTGRAQRLPCVDRCGKEIAFPTTSVVTRRKTIREDRDTVMRFVRSHVEAIAFHKLNKEFALKVLMKYVRTTDPEFLEGSYNIFKQDFIAAPYPITKGLEPTYDYVAQTRPDIRNHKPEEFVDASFISELDKSGFIKRLYEQK